MIEPINNSLRDFIATVNSDGADILGKVVYFSLANCLIDRTRLQEICLSLGLRTTKARRLTSADAFRSATGALYRRICHKDGRIFRAYCRDNKSKLHIISRELVLETVGSTTNEYVKLGNILFDKGQNTMWWENLEYGYEVDPLPLCEECREKFERFKDCANRKHVETITEYFLEDLQATKLDVHGRMYFVPRDTMDRLQIFEDFIQELAANNLNSNQHMEVNSLFVEDSEKQRRKMAEDFLIVAKKEIELLEAKIEGLLETGSTSVSIMNRWIDRVEDLKARKDQYAAILHNNLTECDGEFHTLQWLADQLSLRISSIQTQKCA